MKEADAGSVSQLSQAAEDYLKTILEIHRFNESEQVSMGDLAGSLNLTPGTVTSMVRRLANEGWVDYVPRVGCRLTKSGYQAALRTLRRHRILETFLVTALGMDWSMVHSEAERMEHSASDMVVNLMWEALGCPKVDPHGGFIPKANLEMPEILEDEPLSRLFGSAEVILTRLSDRNPKLLRMLENIGLHPGTRFFAQRVEETGTIHIRGPKDGVVLSLGMAGMLRTRPAG